MTDRTVLCAASLVVAALAGCGGASPEPATTTTDTSIPGPADETDITGPPKPWLEMTFDERKRYMGEQVMPVMAPMFENYDMGEFSGFSCDTCHGEDMQERAFAMPNPGLPALHATGTPEQQQMVEEHPEMVRFMFNDVLPTMQTLLGAEPFDEETGLGFSCFACHPRAGDDGGATAAE